MNVYRIEHISSGLGPFQHNGQIVEVVNKGIHSTSKFMEDIESIPEVISLIKRNGVFGYKTLDSVQRIIKDHDILVKHGFKIALYFDVDIFYIHQEDNQICFLRDKKDKQYL